MSKPMIIYYRIVVVNLKYLPYLWLRDVGSQSARERSAPRRPRAFRGTNPGDAAGCRLQQLRRGGVLRPHSGTRSNRRRSRPEDWNPGLENLLRVRVKLAIPDIQVERDLEKAAEVRSIVCNCLLIIVDAQQVLTMTRTLDGDAYAITSTDPTLVQLGLDYWASPRCCVM